MPEGLESRTRRSEKAECAEFDEVQRCDADLPLLMRAPQGGRQLFIFFFYQRAKATHEKTTFSRKRLVRANRLTRPGLAVK